MTSSVIWYWNRKLAWKFWSSIFDGYSKLSVNKIPYLSYLSFSYTHTFATRSILVQLHRWRPLLVDWPRNLIQDFLSYINSSNPSIKFTLIVEGPTINFLDLTISNKRQTLNIYCKFTCTDIINRSSSFHHAANKSVALNSMIHRIFTVPLLPQDFYNEFNTIKFLAYANGFRLDVDGLIREKSYSLLLDSTTTHPRSTPSSKWIYILFPR